MVEWLLCLLLWPFAPCYSAEEIAAEQGATCERGCIVCGDNWVYEITRDDLVWSARMANCEIANVLDSDDAPATMWSLAQNFCRTHEVGRTHSWGSFVSHYSGCTSPLWMTGGRYYSPRITPIADVNRRTRWPDLPQKVRDYVRKFFRAEIPNRWPGWCWVWTAGYEHHAGKNLIGPFYAVKDEGQSLNAYWKDPATRYWTPWQVRIVAATGVRR